MPDPKAPEEIKELAGGWITERKNTDIPAFLKLCYIVIGGGVLFYILYFMNGEINHSTRGNLVRQMNAHTQGSNGFMYFVAALVLIYLIIAVVFAFRKTHED
jgi:SNF family Na+-dependent transporter